LTPKTEQCENKGCSGIHLTEDEQEKAEKLRNNKKLYEEYVRSMRQDINAVKEMMDDIDESDLGNLMPAYYKLERKIDLQERTIEIAEKLLDEDVSRSDRLDLVIEQHDKAAKAARIDIDDEMLAKVKE